MAVYCIICGKKTHGVSFFGQSGIKNLKAEKFILRYRFLFRKVRKRRFHCTFLFPKKISIIFVIDDYTGYLRLIGFICETDIELIVGKYEFPDFVVFDVAAEKIP